MGAVHSVQQGDCISSIAFEHGFFPTTLWDHPDNSQLKQLRKNPHALLPGDEVHIPDLRVHELSVSDKAKHRYRRKGVPAKLKIRLLVDDQPIANKRVIFEAGQRQEEKTTDGDGNLELPILPDVTTATLRVMDGPYPAIYELVLGGIDPSDTPSGAEARLRNLGYDLEEGLEAALRAFQLKNGLTESGTLDSATRQKLESVYGH